MRDRRFYETILLISSWTGNLVLTLLAFYIAFGSTQKLTPAVFLTVAICILGGNALPIGVYLIQLWWRKAEIEGEERIASEKLRDVLMKANDIEERLQEVHDAAAKAILVGRQIPERIASKVESMEGLLNKLESSELEEMIRNMQGTVSASESVRRRMVEMEKVFTTRMNELEESFAGFFTRTGEAQNDEAQSIPALVEEKLSGLKEQLTGLENRMNGLSEIIRDSKQAEDKGWKDSLWQKLDLLSESLEMLEEWASRPSPISSGGEDAVVSSIIPEDEPDDPIVEEVAAKVALKDEKPEESEPIEKEPEILQSTAENLQEGEAGNPSEDVVPPAVLGEKNSLNAESKYESIVTEEAVSSSESEESFEGVPQPSSEEPVQAESMEVSPEDDQAEIIEDFEDWVEEPPMEEEEISFLPEEAVTETEEGSDSGREEVLNRESDPNEIVEEERQSTVSNKEKSKNETSQGELSLPIDEPPQKPNRAILKVHAMVGIANKITMRGDGPLLSWDKGLPLELVGIGEYQWVFDNLEESVSIKLLLNDREWAEGENIELNPGETLRVQPVFSGKKL